MDVWIHVLATILATSGPITLAQLGYYEKRRLWNKIEVSKAWAAWRATGQYATQPRKGRVRVI